MFGIPEWALGVGLIIVVGSIVKVITARLMPPDYRRRRGLGESLAIPEHLEERLTELDDLKQRVVELEERVDFAERVLAKRREAEPLPPS